MKHEIVRGRGVHDLNASSDTDDMMRYVLTLLNSHYPSTCTWRRSRLCRQLPVAALPA